jgi:hypothetical protein
MDVPRPVVYAALFDYHRHDGVLVRFSPLLVLADDIAYADVAHEVTSDEHEIGCDDAMRVDVAHGITRRESLFGSYDWDDFEPCAGLGPF